MYHDAAVISDSERQIIDQAAAVLAEGRGRTMNEIAELTGIGRTTLYRYFRTREDLLQAVKAQAMGDAWSAVEASCPEEGDAESALRRVIEGLLGVGDRYRVIFGEGDSGVKPKPHHPEMSKALIDLIERGQREGAFVTSLSPYWIRTAMGSLIVAAIRQVNEGELARNHAADTVANTLLGGIRHTPER